MRKGAKRKAASHKQEESHKPAPKAKRAKASKPQPEPEYFEDKRSLWDQLDSVYQFNWNFSNLEDAFEEGKNYMKRKFISLVVRSLNWFLIKEKTKSSVYMLLWRVIGRSQFLPFGVRIKQISQLLNFFSKKGDDKTLEDFIPKSESDFMEYAELISHKLRPHEVGRKSSSMSTNQTAIWLLMLTMMSMITTLCDSF